MNGMFYEKICEDAIKHRDRLKAVMALKAFRLTSLLGAEYSDSEVLAATKMMEYFKIEVEETL